MVQALTFQQLAACLVHAVKELTMYVKGETETMSDKVIEEKIKVIHDIVSLGFSIPQNMAIAILQVLVELMTEKLALEKDFIILNGLKLIKDMYRQISFDKKIN
jgi:hypothetical protein